MTEENKKLQNEYQNQYKERLKTFNIEKDKINTQAKITSDPKGFLGTSLFNDITNKDEKLKKLYEDFERQEDEICDKIFGKEENPRRFKPFKPNNKIYSFSDCLIGSFQLFFCF